MAEPRRPSDESQAVGAILAGGRGSRIGGAKALAELAGRPLISYPLAAVEKAGLEAVVVAKPESELPSLPCRVIREPERPRHPLCGIVAALRDAGGRPVIAIGCDMPFVEPELLAALGRAPEPLVVASLEGRPQPLLARYDATLLAALEGALEREEPLLRTIASLHPRLLDDGLLARFGDPELLGFNVNTLQDLGRAVELLKQAGC